MKFWITAILTIALFSSAGAEPSRKLWSLQPIGRPTPPDVRGSHWTRNPIDNFILARLESQNLHPAPEADKTTLIRRATFDLLGLAATAGGDSGDFWPTHRQTPTSG